MADAAGNCSDGHSLASTQQGCGKDYHADQPAALLVFGTDFVAEISVIG